MPACLESGWCDYSEELRRLRESVEEAVKCFFDEACKEPSMPVVVAPYGSGKTCLLKHLEWYASKKLGLKALRVELAELVDYLVSRRGCIHEHELPRLVEEFFRERTGSRRGVLLVDEVEEAYDILRGVVEHETSPLRGLAEAVYSRSTSVLPVLAFGPSSTLKEAVFGPVAWRCRVFTIPLLPKSVVGGWLAGLGLDGVVAELLANMVWWASKGRVGWARMLVDTVAPKLAKAVAEGDRGLLDAILSSDEALSREVVEGVPVLDRSGYREARRILGDLAPALSVLVGPVPVSVLERFGVDVSVLEPGEGIVVGRSLYRVDDVVGEALAWLSRIARSMGADSASVEHAVEALSRVLEAYSAGGGIPASHEVLAELLQVATMVASDVYADDPRASMLLEKLSPELLAPEAHRAPEPYAAIRPRLLVAVYPTLASTPLEGCAARAGLRRVVELVESSTWEELAKASDVAARELGLEEQLSKAGVLLRVVPYRQLASMSGSLLEEASKTPLVVVLASPEPRLQVPGWLRAASETGRVAVVEASGRLGIYLYGLLYNALAPSPSCLEASRRGMVYAELARSMVIEALASRRRGTAFDTLSRLGVGLGELLAALSRGSLSPWLAQLGEAVCKLEERLSQLLSTSTRACEEAREALQALRELEKLVSDYELEQLPTSQQHGGLEVSSSLRGVVARLGEVAKRLNTPWARGLLEDAEKLLKAVEACGSDQARSKLASRLVSPLVELLGEAVGLAEELAGLVDKLLHAASSLPDNLRSQVARTVEAWLSEARSLREAIAEARDAEVLVAEASRRSLENSSLRSRVDELRSRLLDKLARLRGW